MLINKPLIYNVISGLNRFHTTAAHQEHLKNWFNYVVAYVSHNSPKTLKVFTMAIFKNFTSCAELFDS